MAVTSYDGQFSFKQDSLARLGPRDKKKMSDSEYSAFQNSPFMQAVRKCEDLAFQFTCSRDEERAKRDPSFKPNDSDFTAAKAHEYDRAINYYKVLGIDEYAPLDEVKKAYKKLSLVYHPDKTANLSDEQKEEYAGIFIELKNAYLTLGDQATRRQYDKDRDRDKASFEVQGFKPKVRAHFDATEMLKKLEQLQKPPGKVVDVPASAKLEKFVFGGHKRIARQRRVKDRKTQSFRSEMHQYRVDIPRGAPEPFECAFRRQGDHSETTQPDTINFRISSKPHADVERRGADLICRSSVYLGTDALYEPYVSAQAPSVRGRHVLLWGRNPFQSCPGVAGGSLRVQIKGEGLSEDGSLTVCCRLGTPSSSSSSRAPTAVSSTARALSGASEYSCGSTPGSSSPSGSMALITVRHMQTDATVVIRMPRSATMGDVREKVIDVLSLPRGSTVRLLQQIAGGFTPYPDRQPLNGLTMLNCAGTAWYGVTFSPERAKEFLEKVVAVLNTEPTASELAKVPAAFRESASRGAQAQAQIHARLAELLPDFGLEVSAAVFAERIAHARSALTAAGDMGLAAAVLLARIDELEGLSEASAGTTAVAGGTEAAPVAPAAARRRSTKRFLVRFGLGPHAGFDGPGSDTEEEMTRGGSSGSSAGVGQDRDLTKAPAMLRRIARHRVKERICQLELEQVGEPVVLFTRPTCSITFYSNARQTCAPLQTAAVPPRAMFAISISSPACARKVAAADWASLKDRIVPLLQNTGFSILRAARAALPRPLALVPTGIAGEDNEFRDVEAALVALECGAIDFDACATRREGEEEAERRRRCDEAREEKARALRRWAALECKLAPSADFAVPWKKLGDDAFRRNDFFTGIGCYSRGLTALLGDGCGGFNRSLALLREEGCEAEAPIGEAAQQAAVLLSNRSACLAKAGHFEDALLDARSALDLRPNWGRAWSRIGLAAASLNRFQEAVEAYVQAVSAEPTSANVAALAGAARAFGAPGGRAVEVAHAAKEEGNTAMRAGEFGLAVAHYTHGFAVLPPESRGADANAAPDEHAFLRCVLLCNRSAAFARLRSWALALADAKAAVAAKGDFEKAHCRLGAALLGSGLDEQAYAAFARALVLGANNAVALKGRQACISLLPCWSSWIARQRHRRFSVDLSRPSGSTRVYAIGDVHFDHKCNEEWAHSLDDFKFQEDVLIVAGNMCDTSNALRRALTTFKSKFRRVFYVPGNHEHWIHYGETGKYADSLAKFIGILEICDELGVDVFPAAVCEDTFIVPLFSWYSAEFDTADPFPDPSSKADQHCRWPIPDTQVWKYIMKLNSAHLAHPYHGTVISFSHFLPNTRLPFYGYGNVAKTMGCEQLDDQVRALKGSRRIHVYGHSTKRHAEMIDGVLYVNHYHGEDGGGDDAAQVLPVHDGVGGTTPLLQEGSNCTLS